MKTWLASFVIILLVVLGQSDASAQCRVVNGRMQCNQQVSSPRLLQYWRYRQLPPTQYLVPTVTEVQPQVVNSPVVQRPAYAPRILFRPRYW